MNVSLSQDLELDRVHEYLRGLDPDGTRIGRVLRDTLDQLYDGQRTGRYSWDELYKTERTHCGTLVEINLQRQFKFEDGLVMDYRIAGVEVDCKYSQDLYKWMIPREAVGHLCMLLWADDQRSIWSLGLVRIREEMLVGGNQDGKRTIAAYHREKIRRVFWEAALPPNILLQLPDSTVKAIKADPSGIKRVSELFRRVQRQRIGRAVVATVGRQADPMKRARGNGGARSLLQPEGIIILGRFKSHRKIAKDLGIPVPRAGEFVSVRVTKVESSVDHAVEIDGSFWRVATEGDSVEPAPNLPKK